MGAYHDKLGFDTFSHKKAVIKRGNWIDPPVRYAPYTDKKLNILKQSNRIIQHQFNAFI